MDRTEMRRTLENKVKFFELYSASVEKTDQLELKRLEGITGKDALEACKIAFSIPFIKDETGWYLNKYPNGDSWLLHDKNECSFLFTSGQNPDLLLYTNLKKSDIWDYDDLENAWTFLRNKGYALPYNLIDLEYLEKWGWIRFQH